jgi:hypothetical protein
MNSASGLGAGLDPAARFPDFTLSDHAGNERRLSDLVGGDPTVGSRETTDTLNDPYGSANPWPGDRFAGQGS